MRRNTGMVRMLAAAAIVVVAAGCTKMVRVPPAQYETVLGGENFIHVTTTDGKVFQLQEARLTETGLSGLLRHAKGDVRPVGAGGREKRSAWVEIRLEDVQSVEVERINKKRVLIAFGAIAGGLAAAIIAVEASEGEGGGGGGGEPPIKDL